MLGERHQAAAAELAQWWEGIREGGIGSQAVLLARPPGWGRSTVLDELAKTIGAADGPVSPMVRISGRSLPGEPGPQAAALRDALLVADVRRQAAGLLSRTWLRRTARRHHSSLLASGITGTISLMLVSLAGAASGVVADDDPGSPDGIASRAARVVAAVSESGPVAVIIDDADRLDPGLAVTVIENLIDHHASRVLVVAAVDLDSDLAAALSTRAQRGPTVGRVHRAGADPRMGRQSRADLAGELSPHLTAAQAQQLARRTRTFAEVFEAARSMRLS